MLRKWWALQALDAQLPNLAAGTSAAVYGVENLTSEIEDLLSYCNDILDTGNPTLDLRPLPLLASSSLLCKPSSLALCE